MEKVPNRNNIDGLQPHIRDLAREFYERINKHAQGERMIRPMASSSETTTIRFENVSEAGKEGVQQHMISGIAYRCNRLGNTDQWQLETVWENSDICELDAIRQAVGYEWQPVNYNGDQNYAKTAMAEDSNLVLFRTIMDWSHPDGNVWSQQIIWTGDFADCQRVLQMLGDNPSAVQVLRELFHVEPQLREQHIARHSSRPLAATMAAVDSCRTIVVSEELVGMRDCKGDAGLICSVCYDTISIGKPAKQLRCNHVYHRPCIFRWFYRNLSCPECRHEMN